MKEITYFSVTLVLVGIWMVGASRFTGMVFWGFTALIAVIQLGVLSYAISAARHVDPSTLLEKFDE